MKELLEYLAKSLVTHPDAVRISEVDREGRLTLRLEVADDDRGRVIGRSGKTAMAIRTLVGAVAAREGRSVNVEIAE